MKHITANTAQKEFDSILTNVTCYNESVAIVSDNDMVGVLISMEDGVAFKKRFICSLYLAW